MGRISDTELGKVITDDIIVNRDQMCVCDGVFSSDGNNMVMKVEMMEGIKSGKHNFFVIYIIFDANFHSQELQEVFDTEESLDFGDVLTLNIWFGHGKGQRKFWDKLAEYLTLRFPFLSEYKCTQINLTQTSIKDVQAFKSTMKSTNYQMWIMLSGIFASVNSYAHMFHTCTQLKTAPALHNNIQTTRTCV